MDRQSSGLPLVLQRSLKSAAVVVGALALAACANNPYSTAPQVPEPRQQPPQAREPAPVPPPIQAPPAPRAPAIQKAHPRYAPPPHGSAHWDNRLGVYVLEGRRLFYRERLYYRWNGDWFCAGHPDGPWEPVAPPSVPTGLRGLH